MSGRAGRQLRDALLLLASLGVALAALLSGRAKPVAPSSAAADVAARSPPPLPSGAADAPIAVPEHEDQGGCDFVDRGFGDYERWRPLPLGNVLIAPGRAIGRDGAYDLLVHFHGAEPVRKVLAPLDTPLVIVGVDAGTRTSDYARALAGGAWQELLRAVDREVAVATGRAEARAGHLAVSSWSAGSGALSRIVEAGKSRIDAVILLDSLYGSYAPGRASMAPGQLAAFVALANAAARGGPIFYLTHTAVPTRGYPSTEETAAFLLREIGASPIAITTTDDEGDPASASAASGHGSSPQLTRMYDGGSLYVRGYAGADREAHCAQLRLLPAILAEHVLPAFKR